MKARETGPAQDAQERHRSERRWAIDVAVTFSVYGVLVVGAPLVAQEDWPASARVAIALAPTVPVLYFVRALLAFYRTRDELERRNMAEATVASAVVVGFGSFAWGWLEVAGIAPALHSIWILPALVGVFGAAMYFVGRRYR